MKVAYNDQPLKINKGKNRDIAVFPTEGKNIDPLLVKSFGEEWLKFHDFSDKIIDYSLLSRPISIYSVTIQLITF